MLTAAASLGGQPSRPAEAGCDSVEAQIRRLRDENNALKAALCGLCMSLAQMSEINRAIVAQAFDFAGSFGAIASSGPGGDNPESRRAQADVINEIRSAVLRHAADHGARF